MKGAMLAAAGSAMSETRHPLGEPDLPRRAFDAVAQAQRAFDLPELNRVVGETLRPMGFTHFLGATASEGPQGLAVDVTFGVNHQAWEQHYQSRGYACHDAVLREMLRTGEPVFWSDLPARREVPEKGARIIAEAREFGLNDGFGVPIFHLDGSVSTVLLMGQHVDAADPDVRASAHLLSLYYGSISRRLRRAEQNPPRIRLTQRQLECLRWVRHGKSSTDIGEILGLSSHTVDEHLAGACHHLGVRTRCQAVAEAAALGIFEL